MAPEPVCGAHESTMKSIFGRLEQMHDDTKEDLSVIRADIRGLSELVSRIVAVQVEQSHQQKEIESLKARIVPIENDYIGKKALDKFGLKVVALASLLSSICSWLLSGR